MSVLDPSNYNSMRRNPIYSLALALLAAAGCSNHDATGPNNGTSFSVNPCSISGTLQLSAAQTAVADCSNGGTTVTLAGNGASYLVVAQFAASLVPNAFVPYHVSSGTAISALRTLARTGPFASRSSTSLSSSALAITQPRAKQLAFDRMLRGRARQRLKSGKWSRSYSLSRTVSPSASISATTIPSVGSVRNFQVLSNNTGSTTSTVSARLVYAGTDVLIYVDTLSPANGFTSDQLNAFGQLFDQTLYPIDVTNFGPPSDIDQNGRVIMLMTPVVNALTRTISPDWVVPVRTTERSSTPSYPIRLARRAAHIRSTTSASAYRPPSCTSCNISFPSRSTSLFTAATRNMAGSTKD
jgi:hypothetical protein